MTDYDRIKAWSLSIFLSFLAYFAVSWLMVRSAMIVAHGSSKPIEIVITLPQEETPKAVQKREERPKPQPKVRPMAERPREVKKEETKKEVPKTPTMPIKEETPSTSEKEMREETPRKMAGEEVKREGTNQDVKGREDTKKEDVQAKAPPPPRPPQSAGEKQNPLLPYMAQVRSIIEKNKRYPEEAKRRGEEGVAVVRVRIAGDGKVEEVSLVKGSGSSSIDREVIAMIRRIGKFPPPPFAPLEFNLEVEYKLGG